MKNKLNIFLNMFIGVVVLVLLYGWVTDCPGVIGYSNKADGCKIKYSSVQ